MLAQLIEMPKSLRQHREERYETVDEFAAFLGISLDTLYRIQKGERPRYRTMRRIAEKLGVHPSEIREFVPRDLEGDDGGGEAGSGG